MTKKLKSMGSIILKIFFHLQIDWALKIVSRAEVRYFS